MTVVPREPLAYLTIWPTGSPQPLVSTLNSTDGRYKANAAIVPAGVNGSVSVYVSNSTDVVLDVDGYFTSPNLQTLAFYPVIPCRVADTRIPTGQILGNMLSGTRTVRVDSWCGIPSAAKAVLMNYTAQPYLNQPLAYLSTWPTGGSRTQSSTLNAPSGTIVANAAFVPLGNNGSVEVFTSGSSDFILDLNGYFAPPGPGGLLFYPLTPCRVTDTRGRSAMLSEDKVFPIAGFCGVPSDAKAYSLNATIVPPGPVGYLTLYPTGSLRPLASTLNAYDGKITSNAAVLPAGTAGSISAYSTHPTDILFDINGYFAP